MACLLTTSIVFGDYAAIQVWCGDVTYIWTGKPGGVMFHSDSNNADVSLYHHLVCRLTRLV